MVTQLAKNNNQFLSQIAHCHHRLGTDTLINVILDTTYLGNKKDKKCMV